MKNNNKLTAVIALTILLAVAIGCSMSTANMSSLKTFADKEGKNETTSYKTGETIYGEAQVSNNPGKVSVKYKLVVEEAKGMTKGDFIKGSDVSVDIEGDKVATFAMPIPAGAPGGKYILTADMHNEAGEKKDGKTTTITVVEGAKPSGDSDDDDDK